ncbi:YjgN family protein [Solimonas soli]|uniref:YjgN family protein n=1 Tax=Solimonas soli TaxID=413479 RepID=UPI00048581E6|nr:YjgN family protein [Solimonas soli]
MDHVEAAPGRSIEPFRFNGSGSEYFGIWIVNVLLTIITLGIYSPWAKVRRMQYFYRNTELAGSSFDYHGRPLAILKGRLLALGLLLIYHFATTHISIWTLLALAILALALPWLLRNALRFRAHYSSYRGLRFSFRGSLGQAYAVFLGYPILMFITAYLAGPLFHQRLKRYQHGNSYYGGTAFAFDAGVGRFYRTYVLYMLAGAALLALAFVPMFHMLGAVKAVQAAGGKPDPAMMMSAMGVFWLAIMFGVLILGPLLQAAVQNLIWNHTALGPHRFVSRLSGWRLMGIGVSNFLLVALTLGLFMPWAAVRLARYRASCTSLAVDGSLDAIVGDAERGVAALGEETAELFDIDIGL